MRNEQRVQQAIERIRATVTDPARLHSGSTRFELWATDIFDLLDLAEEVNNLRRQLAEAQAEIDAVPREEIADLYDAYAYATAGGSLREFDDGKAREFPKVGVWLGLLPNPVSPWEEA